MMRGKVKFFCDVRGFGFIRPDDNTPDVFVHRTDLAPPLDILATDQSVSFETVDADKGRKAISVSVVATHEQPAPGAGA